MNSLHPVNLLKRVLTSDILQRQVANVSVGDKFEHIHTGAALWVVEKISTVAISPIPLVSLVRDGHPEIKKTISLSVLSEGEDYRVAG